jgi:nucleoside-diphosphate-sugar epimerase
LNPQSSILLTGASGFLGKAIAEQLKLQHKQVITIGRSKHSDIVCDLSAGIPQFKNGIDTVIHAMGKAHTVPKNDAEAADFFAVNVQGTKNLCAALQKLEQLPAQFLFVSSVAVYGCESGVGITEDWPLLGKSPYAKSKIEAENYLTTWCHDHNIKLSIVRLPLVAGENAPGNLGAMANAIAKGRYFNIGKGDAKKSMVLASDIGKWALTIANAGGVYNLTDGEHPSFAQLASVLAKKSGKNNIPSLPLWLARLAAFAGNFLGKKAPINTDRLEKICSTLIFDDSKARVAFGWKPQSVLKELSNN